MVDWLEFVAFPHFASGSADAEMNGHPSGSFRVGDQPLSVLRHGFSEP